MRRCIVVRADGAIVGRVDTSWCAHCTDEAICSVCGAKADAMRAAPLRAPRPDYLK